MCGGRVDMGCGWDEHVGASMKVVVGVGAR